MLAAAEELLEQRGLGAVTVDAIGSRAGVSKATIYRWWGSKEEIALEAFYLTLGGPAAIAADTGSLAGDLLGAVRARVRLLADRPSVGRTMAGLIAQGQEEPEFAAAYGRLVVEPLRVQARAAFQRAIERAEIRLDADVEAAIDLLFGGVYHRVWQSQGRLDDGFARALVEIVMNGIATPRGEPVGQVVGGGRKPPGQPKGR